MSRLLVRLKESPWTYFIPLAAVVIIFCALFYFYVFSNLLAYLVPPSQADRLSVLGRINLVALTETIFGAGILPSEIAHALTFCLLFQIQ
jgi:hypothetical protein